ncbi:HDL067Cp [Eremothecium sinecaudum]|uniref:HDL067Cp n=1 Tax=Eremothecium sinecaudum TaxID=45286 RepID=A0A0X8HSG4_9SACH|nr:HDL067Cp [Eremothecium sinecaudum]AMD20677.1 HDL067Cp [Eremothecium sinecaudum]
MSQEDFYSTSPRRRRSGFHGVRVHMLPTEPAELKRNSSAYDSSQTNGNVDEDAQIDNEYTRMKPHSSFEADEDFKFKRRKSKNGALGERLDSLQNMQNAKWMDNFNSSMQHPQLPPPVNEYVQPPPPQYMPYMYYYPMPALAPHHMLPTTASPQKQANNLPSSMQGYPNTSTQPFYPHRSSSQLMPPPPQMYPGYYAQEARNPGYSRERRRTIMAQRGRRLSMLSLQGEENVDVMKSEVISPHKDVPESDFYRHIANTSFGRGLQIRQLFIWCLIRCLRKLETQDEHITANENNSTYINPRRIRMVILREFVQDLRKGKIDVDWDCNNIVEEEQYRDDTEDTVLRELFDDDNEDKEPGARRTAKRKLKLVKIPNEKNIQNLENVRILEEKISKLKSEIQRWSTVLDDNTYQTNWEALRKPTQVPTEPGRFNLPPVPKIEDVKLGFSRRIDTLYGSAHLLHSHARLLNKTIQIKSGAVSRTLTKKTIPKKPTETKQFTRKLLLSLSKLMASNDQQHS